MVGLLVIIGMAVGATFAAALAAAVISLAAAAFIMALWHRGSDLVDAWDDWPWYKKVGGAFKVLLASAGDVFGITGVIEGHFEEDFVTGRQLSPEEASERFWIGAFTILTMGLIHFFVKPSGSSPKTGRRPLELGEGEKPPVETTETTTATEKPVETTPETATKPAETTPETTTKPAETTTKPAETPETTTAEKPPAADKPSTTEPYDALAKKHKLSDAVDEVLRETNVDPAVADSLLSRGVKPDTIAEVAIDFGPDGVRALDGLTRAGIEPRIAIESLKIGRDTGTLPDVIDLASGKLENASGLRAFLEGMQKELKIGLNGKRNELAEAANQARGGDRVSVGGRKKVAGDPESGQADVVNYSSQDAIQMKTVTAEGENSIPAVVSHTRKAVGQLQGKFGEVPPDGFQQIAWTKIENPKNALYGADRATLEGHLKGDLGLKPTDADMIIRIENGNPGSPFEFRGSELM
jgi:hypothetical protein